MPWGTIRDQLDRREISGAFIVKITLLVTLGVAVVALSAVAVNQTSSQQGSSVRPGPIPTFTTLAAPDGAQSTLPTAVFLGDSYTHGTGASTPALRWSSLVANAKGWTEADAGLGGTGYATTSSVNGCGKDYCPTYVERVGEIVASSPSVVVVSGGQNDGTLLSSDPETVKAAVDATYSTLRAGLPDAEIVAVGPSAPGTLPATLIEFDGWVHTAADAVGATYVSLIDPPVIVPEMVLPDGGHVDDSGHQAIADRILGILPAS